MIVTLTGELLRFLANGVGAIQVTPPKPNAADAFPDVVYFQPGDIANYGGQTIQELQHEGLRPGKKLAVDVRLDDAGRFLAVASVHLD